MRLLALLLFFAVPAVPAFGATDQKAEAKAKLEAIEEELDAWDVNGARELAAELEKTVPAEVEPLLYYQGRIAFEEGRYPEAIDLLKRAGLEDKPDSYVRLAIDTERIVRDYKKVESAHFIFEYPDGKDAVLAPYALETLEAQRTALEQDLGFAPKEKIRVEVVADAKELAKVSTLTAKQIRTTGTIAICKFNKLMVTSPKAVVRGYDWQDTLAHEYVHLVVSQASRNTVPIWLQEGLAKYLESRWRGEAGLALSPPSRALLGHRVKTDKLIPFEKMHPSIALLPTAEDAATAFAEVFFAIDLIYRNNGRPGLQALITNLKAGKTDRQAVEAATGKSFATFEKAWLAHVKKQPFPMDLLPMDQEEVTLKEDAPGASKRGSGDGKKKGKEISFGEFAIVKEKPAREFAHLGEVMREKNRSKAAALEFGKAHAIVGDKYQPVSDKYALALLDIGETAKAEQVLLGSLKTYPGVASTQVHLGRIYLAQKEWQKAKRSFLDALSSDPFDPEIHISLYAADRQLNDTAHAKIALEHSKILTSLDDKAVQAVAQKVLERSGTKLSTSAVDSALGPEEPQESEAPVSSQPTPGVSEAGGPVTGGKVGPGGAPIGSGDAPEANVAPDEPRGQVAPDDFLLNPTPEKGVDQLKRLQRARAALSMGLSLKGSMPDQAAAAFREAMRSSQPGESVYEKAKAELDALGFSYEPEPR